MKFKRIDVDTVRCLISEEELFENGLEVDDFLQNSEKTEDFLRKILARAAEEVGYRIQGGNISIQVAVLPDHVLALTFSEKPDHGIMNMLDHLKHAVDAISQNVQERKEASENVVPERNVQEERAMKMVGRPEYQLSFDSLEQVIQYCRNVLLELPVDSDLYKLEERNVYLPTLYYAELNCARMLWDLNIPLERDEEYAMKQIASLEAQEELELDDQQRIAVKEAMHSGLLVVTGGPGTGKTTTINMIIRCFEKQGMSIMLAAPTGRAAKRMTEATGCEAQTIHRMLEYNGAPGEQEENVERGAEQFGRNEWNPLETDVIIIDEMSMVDIYLFHSLLKAVAVGTRLILVGDVNQLPSVGAGNVLYEMIHCGLIPVTVLDEIFRQDKDSSIPYNARLINQGCTKLHDGSDFTFISSVNQVKAAEVIAERYCQEIEENGIEQVQILSPFREDGAASAAHLNAVIRERVNPFCSTEDEIHSGTMSFRVGDRIMQTKNTEHVSNGDLGFIRYVKDTPEGKRIGMDFGVGRELEYGIEDLSHIELSYATTVHKAMGSEFPIILIPILEAHKIMLYRNLLYTAVTRAKTKVILVGQKSALLTAIHRNGNNKRNTLLGHRIRLYYRAFAKSAGIPIPADLEELELKNAG